MRMRVCIVCGTTTLNATSRCGKHPRAGGTSSGRGARKVYDSRAWKRLRATKLAEHRARYGDVCPGWSRPAHPSRQLTLDHVHPLAMGGAGITDAVQVLCASCNTRRRNHDMPRGWRGGRIA